MNEDRYARRGVSAGKEEVHAAIERLDKGLFPTAFCKVLPDIAGGDPDWCNLIHADTAGTKTSLAYLYWRETGDASVWAGIAQDALVMNLDDLACVGAVQDILISSTIGRNKHRIPGEVIRALIDGTSDFLERMAEFGVRIHHGGGETADVGDIVRTVDVGITAFARMRRQDLVVNAIRPGALVVGLSSTGRAAYEDSYNGGMGSNGLTSARHDVFSHEYADRYPESFSPETDLDVVYSGSRTLTEAVSIPVGNNPTDQSDNRVSGMDLGRLVLSPTRTYLPVLLQVLESVRPSIQGMIHCSGGAQTKVLHFIENVRVVKDNLFPLPELFRLIQAESGTDWREMYRVFNMGHRLEVYLSDESAAQRVIAIAEELGVGARIVGRCEAAEGAEVLIRADQGEFRYSA